MSSGSGWGGSRVGSGRKPKDVRLKVLHGTATRAERARAKTLAPVVEFDPPAGLTDDERNVWLRLAPPAFGARTLTRTSEYAFLLLCRNLVLEHQLRRDVARRGSASHRGLIQRVEAALGAFGLRPTGRPMMEPPPDDDQPDPFDEFVNAKAPTH